MIVCMNRTELLDQFQTICRDVFEDDSLMLTEEASAKDIESWDSLSHLMLVNALQDHFHVTLSLDEIMNSACIGDLMDAVANKL